MKKTVCLALLLVFALGLRADTNAVFKCQVKVVDAQGQPVSGALVEHFRNVSFFPATDPPQPAGRDTTGSKGAVSLTSTNRANCILVASKPGLALTWGGWLPVAAPNEDNTAVELVLTPPKAVAGVVRDAAGKPVADALVWVNLARRATADSQAPWISLPPSLGRQLFSARTGADGKFRIEGLPDGAKLNLAVSKPGMTLDRPHASVTLRALTRLEIEAGQSDLVLTLQQAGAIEGRVVKTEGGAPIAGARVTFSDLLFDDRSTPSAISGPDGAFRCADLEAGEYQLQARLGTNEPPELVCEPKTITVEAGVTNRAAKLTLSAGGLLEVTVKNSADEKPTAGAIVYVTVPGERRSMKPVAASEKGIARLRLPPGDYQVYARKGQNSSNRGQVSVELNKTNQTTVSLAAPVPRPKLTGTVVDSAGKPAPKVAVSLLPYGRRGAQSDAQGHFELELNPNQFHGMANYQPLLIALDSARNLAVALDVEEDPTNVNLRLESALTLAGRVTDPDDKPVPNAQATLMFRTDRMLSSFGSPTRTDAQGRFEIKGLPPGRPYSVTVSAIGFGQDNKNVEAADTATNRMELGTFQLPLANLRLAGRVLDADDKPVAGAMINTYGGNQDEQPQLRGRTDSKGHFSFAHVCPGPITLSANDVSANNLPGRQYATVSAEGGDTNVTLRLVSPKANVASGDAGSRQKINGTVLDPDGKPAARVMVNLFPPFAYGQKTTDDAGRFVLTPDPDTTFGLADSRRVIIARDLERNLAAALDLEDDATNATLRLAPGFTLVGQATDPDAKPLTNAQAQLLFRVGPRSSNLGQAIRADAQGQLEIKALPAGRRFTVTVSAKGYGQDSHDAQTDEGENRRVEPDAFQLAPANLRLAGVVLDADDKPVAAFVNGYGKKQPQQTLSGRTDSKGHFSFAHVCSGPITLSANDLSANSLRGSERGSVFTEGGDTNITIRLGSIVESRATAPRPVSLRGKPLPDLAAAGLTTDDVPANQPVLALLIDAEQRPCRRVLRLLGDQAPALKQKGVAVVVLQSGVMTDEAFIAWKQEAASPFPVGRLKQEPEQARAAWGARALPWFILTDKSHRVIAEGFTLDDLDAKLGELK
jgi:protocatechuate 3,4-dioxygenase beta subunit